MAIVNGSLQEGYKDAAWFAANPTLVLLVGQKVNLEQTGTYKLGDGVTQLSALSFLGGGSGVQSVTGPNVDNTDPANPVVNPLTQNLQYVTDNGANTTNQMQINGVNVATVNDIPSLSGYVDTAGLTTNTIPKATASDTIGDSSITDDGTKVTVNSGFYATNGSADVSAQGTSAYMSADQQSNTNIESNLLGNEFTHNVKNTFNAPANYFPQLTPSQIVETDASKNLVSVAKATGYNLALGTTAGTVLEGNKGVLKAGDSMSGALNEAKSTDIVSATTTDLSTSTGNLIHITGTTTITSFGTLQAGSKRTLVFDGALTLTYNATSLILPGAANITTSAGDTAIFISEGSGNWRCVSYITASDTYINFAPSFTGFSVAPTVNTGDCRYKMLSRNTCHFICYPSNLGTSNATTFTITLPFASANVGVGGQTYIVQLYNNGASATGVMRIRLNSNIADVYTANFGTFTASGGKRLICSIVYQTEL